MYVGSSSCTLTRLEYNHRNAWKIGYTITFFRSELMSTYRGKGTFAWLVEPYMCTQQEIETVEEAHISFYIPRCNIDKDPVVSSKKYRRY